MPVVPSAGCFNSCCLIKRLCCYKAALCTFLSVFLQTPSENCGILPWKSFCRKQARIPNVRRKALTYKALHDYSRFDNICAGKKGGRLGLNHRPKQQFMLIFASIFAAKSHRQPCQMCRLARPLVPVGKATGALSVCTGKGRGLQRANF